MGSSPLARGLRPRGSSARGYGGIIPARAGFTPTSPLFLPPRPDHPRSRGVYASEDDPFATRVGSSPLARGLRPRGSSARGYGGIIPARAGFTVHSPARAPHGEDHPRSRGVYAHVDPYPRLPHGSSPLARGLREDREGVLIEPGIIPARAGFTQGPLPLPPIYADHPRSRGVYGAKYTGYMLSGGSSPLARGLLFHYFLSANYPRIIPARAGFTATHSITIPMVSDHPRSRGVYRSFSGSFRMGGGSSPLARGLQLCGEHAAVEDGIIPARAGFTRRSSGVSMRTPDHPRSRGVYSSSDRGAPIRMDHPRSRGVYPGRVVPAQ